MGLLLLVKALGVALWLLCAAVRSLTYLWGQLLLNGNWDWQWEREEAELLVEVVLEDESQESGALDHFLLSGLSWRWCHADEAGDEDRATEDLNELHFDVIWVVVVVVTCEWT